MGAFTEVEDGHQIKQDEKRRGSANSALAAVTSYAQGQTLTTEHHVGTKRGIKSRHAQMIAIGGSIGTGLFVGAGQALAAGGPGFLLLCYGLMSLNVYGIMTAVIEIAAHLPISGSSMAYYANRYVSSSMGFALGWLYFYSFGIIVAYEITAASLVINYWPSTVPVAVWITIMLIVIVGLNLSPVGVYAETEFWFASIKIIMILGLLMVSVILFWGGGPSHDRLGFRYWNDPGAVKAYIIEGSGGKFTAFLYVWVFSGFSFYFSPELMSFTAGEMKAPRKNLPTAARRFFWRLIVFYILSTIAIGVICASNDKGLTSGAGNANASPWVIAIRNAGIKGLDSVINAGIITSAWSSGNSYLYMSSRSLYSLAVAGNAPKIFARCNRHGLPIYAVLVSCLFALLAYLNVGSSSGVVFNWFISLTNTAGYTSWACCCIIYLRFRKACTVQGLTNLTYRSFVQPYASYICLVVNIVLLLANGFTVFYPGRFTVSGFLTTYLGIPIFLVLYLGHRLFHRQEPWIRPSATVDLITGMDQVEAAEKDALDADEMHQQHPRRISDAAQVTSTKKWLDKLRVDRLWE